MVWRRVERWLGLVRSLIIYWRPGRQRGLRELYRPFVGPGSGLSTWGAPGRPHGGVPDAGRQGGGLGAPARRAPLARAAGGAQPGRLGSGGSGGARGRHRPPGPEHRTPTMSSLAEDWPSTMSERNAGFAAVRWDDSVTVPVTTLDALIEEYGLPRFCKIDVEGTKPRCWRG